MKNLSKVLALVLAVAMLVSFAAVAGAKFTDADAISEERTEAAEILNALGVLKGDANANFNPKGILSRAEAAKIAAVLDLGEDKVSNIYGAMSSFTDMGDAAWAKNYVGYCVANGIVAGTSATTFAPEDKLTATAFAKILLTVLDYDADVEGFVGANWNLKVLVAAENNKLFAGVEDIDPNAGLTREDAAQMLLNALKAKKVASYDATTKKANIGTEKLMKNFGLQEGTAGTDALGCPTTEWKQNGKVIATFPAEAAAEFTAAYTGADVLAALGFAAKDTIKVDGADFTKASKGGEQGTKTLFFEDGEKEFSTVTVATYFGQITDKADKDGKAPVKFYKDGTAVTGKTFKTSLPKKTYVLVTLDADGNIYAVEEAEAAAAAVTAVKNSTGEVKLDSAYAKFAAQYVDLDSIGLYDGTTIASSLINTKKNYTFYFDTYGNVIAIAKITEEEKPAEATKYAYVTKTWSESVKGDITNYALITTDENESLEVVVKTAPAKDALYTYTEKDGVYTFTAAPAATTDVSKTASAAKVGGAYANDSTKFFIKKVDSKGKVSFESVTGYKGLALPTGSKGFVEAKDSKALFVYVDTLAEEAPATTTDKDVSIVLAVNAADRESATIYSIDVLVNGETKAVSVDETKLAPSALAVGDTVILTFDAKGNAIEAKTAALTEATLNAKIDDETFYATTDKEAMYTLNDDTVILAINTKNADKYTVAAYDWADVKVGTDFVLIANKTVASVIYVVVSE